MNFPESFHLNNKDRFTAMYQRISLGFGIQPDYLGDSDLKLVSLFTLPEEINKDVWLLTHSDLRKVKHIQSFMEFVRKLIENNSSDKI